MRWPIGILIGIACVVVTMPGSFALGSCPEQAPGELQLEAELTQHDTGDGLFVRLVFENRGKGPLLIYPHVVPMACHRPQGPYLYLEITLRTDDGDQRMIEGECPGRLRTPSGYEFLPLLPHDFLGRHLNLRDEPFLLPEVEPGSYELELAVRSEAREYVTKNHPDDLPCSSQLVFQGRVQAGVLKLVVPETESAGSE